MKFTTALLVTFILAIEFGSTPVAANGGALTADLFDQLLVGVKTLLDLVLKALFNSINSLLLLLFKSLLNLVTLLIPGETQLNLATLLPPLLALGNPTLATLAKALFTILGIDGTAILALIPDSVGKTSIKLDTLLKTAAPLLQGKKITLANLLLALALYLSRYEYSIKLSSP